jgi:hypothetical protein
MALANSGDKFTNFSNVEVGSTTGGGAVKMHSYYEMTPILTAALPAAAAANVGQVRMISDNGLSNNEYALVISNGTAWVTADGNALD